MQITNARLILVLLLIVSTCLLEIHAKGGRGGGGSRGGSRGRGSTSTRRRLPTSRPASRPSPRPAYQPSPRPAPAPKPTPRVTARPQPAPTQRSQPAPASPKPSAPEQPVVARQPAANPNYKETSPVQGSSDSKQPAYNPNYKPEGGAPPPYSPAGHPVPNAPQGQPPPYQPMPNLPNAPLGQPPPYGSTGQRAPYPQNTGGQPPAYPGQSAPYPVQPPAYPGLPGRTPGQSAPYPQQPGYPGNYPQQPGYPGRPPGQSAPYPQQPGYPGNYPQQPGGGGGYRPYPVQPGISYPGGGYRPYPQQPLGGNVWRPQSGMPAPAYMNHGGMPTGTNMYAAPHKKKGFLGSLMSMGHSKPKYGKQNKYGSYPSPYAVAGGMAAGGMAGGLLGRYGKSAAMYTIMPFMAARAGSSLFRPRLGLGLLPMFLLMPHFSHHHHYGPNLYPRYAHYYDVYSNDYAGKCQRPLKKEHTEIRCKSTYDDIKCDAKCEDGYNFPENITLISNRCWHVTGIWRPRKNFPACMALCDDDCMNGGECIRPGVCKCPAEFRGDRCQFHFLDCDVRKLTKGEKNLGWVCNHTRNETTCRIRCKPPAAFESPPAAEEYKCTPQGVWTPDWLPRCTENTGGNSTEVNEKDHAS